MCTGTAPENGGDAHGQEAACTTVDSFCRRVFTSVADQPTGTPSGLSSRLAFSLDKAPRPDVNLSSASALWTYSLARLTRMGGS